MLAHTTAALAKSLELSKINTKDVVIFKDNLITFPINWVQSHLRASQRALLEAVIADIEEMETIMYPEGEHARWYGRQEYIKKADLQSALREAVEGIK